MAPVKVVALASADGQTLSQEEAAARLEAKRAASREAKRKHREEGEGDAYDELFDAAQVQLQREMAAAGMDGQLPMSFGGTREVGRPRSKKRRRGDEESERVKETKIVEKVHVVYDSDGEVSARKVENVEVVVPLEQETPKVQQEKEPVVAKPRSKLPVPKDVRKFWEKRNVLFYKYDEGIQLDHESWYSVTPQAIAEHIAERCRCDVVVDPFAGCGGNVIQLAKTCRQVIAIDVDPEKIRMAKHNAAIYGVADKIEFIVGDSTKILPTLKHADVVFLSPPWGGLKYSRKRYDMEGMVINGVTGSALFALARRLTKNIVYYMPKTTPVADLEALAPDEPVECEMVVLNKTSSVMTAYYGDLVRVEKEDGQKTTKDVEQAA